jgi:hypothetical protein
VFRIDSPSAVPSIPITPPPFAPGFFTDGNPASGAEATIVDAWWLNMVQEEILTVITSIGMAPDKADSSQLYQAIQRIAEAANPDLAGFLPLSGGVLYRPGGGDLLTIRVDQQATPALHARLISTVIGVRTWALGTDATGAFSITDISGDVVRMILGTGGVMTYNGNANISGNLTANASQITTEARAGQMTTTELNVGGQGIQYPALGPAHKIGWAFDGVNLSPRIDGIWSGGFSISGSIGCGSISVAGRAQMNGGFDAGNSTVNGDLGVNFALSVAGVISSGSTVQGALLYSSGEITCPGTVRAGALSISGYGEVGTFGVHGTANVVGTLTAGWVNSSGDFAITQNGAFSSNGNQIDICQTGTRANVGQISLKGNFVQSLGTHDVYGDLRVQGTIVNPWQPLLTGDAIEPYERGLAEIRQLMPVIYDQRRRLVGLVLDDCREVMPEMVSRVTDHAGDTTEGLNTGALSYALVNAVKELAERVEELETAWPKPVPA